MPHPVLDAVLPACARNFVLHSRLVALKKREVVTEDQKFRDFRAVRDLLGARRGLTSSCLLAVV